MRLVVVMSGFFFLLASAGHSKTPPPLPPEWIDDNFPETSKIIPIDRHEIEIGKSEIKGRVVYHYKFVSHSSYDRLCDIVALHKRHNEEEMITLTEKYYWINQHLVGHGPQQLSAEFEYDPKDPSWIVFPDSHKLLMSCLKTTQTSWPQKLPEDSPRHWCNPESDVRHCGNTCLGQVSQEPSYPQTLMCLSLTDLWQENNAGSR